ncbi:MAG: carbon-nitrogen hydrolase family protein [Firmicutes bacterium]|nr:carbon-nitrogen hydrolase family protein [Bacillota bacterium]
MKKMDEPSVFKVSAIQPKLKRYDREFNINRCVELISREAEREKSHFICIPNYFFQTGTETLPGPATLKLAQLAEKFEMFIIGGMAESNADGKAYNTGFIILPDGEIRNFQRKTHMIPMESRKLSGGDGYFVIDAGLAKVGCVMCNDVFYPEAARCVALQGAEIIFSPSMIGGTGVFAMKTAAMARAVENQVYFINANGIPLEVAEDYPGLEMGWSGIYSPFPENIVLASAGSGEEVIRAYIDLDELRELKKSTGQSACNLSELAEGKAFNMLASRRPELYGRITEMTLP